MSKLHCIRSPWHRFLFSLCLSCLLLINHFTSPRARIHWIGRYGRPRRPERALMVLLFVSAILLLEARQIVVWSIVLGGVASILINLHALYQLIPRKRAHWIS